MYRFQLDDWQIWLEENGELEDYVHFLKNADFVDEIEIDHSDLALSFIGIEKGSEAKAWPSVVILQTHSHPTIFPPGFLVVPENSLVFIGAGERLLCYDIERRCRLWEDQTSEGFWKWSQHGQYVFLSAETEFGVWTKSGRRLWTTFVDPPWDYEVTGSTVNLSHMDIVEIRQLADGKLEPS